MVTVPILMRKSASSKRDPLASMRVCFLLAYMLAILSMSRSNRPSATRGTVLGGGPGLSSRENTAAGCSELCSTCTVRGAPATYQIKLRLLHLNIPLTKFIGIVFAFIALQCQFFYSFFYSLRQNFCFFIVYFN